MMRWATAASDNHLYFESFLLSPLCSIADMIAYIKLQAQASGSSMSWTVPAQAATRVAAMILITTPTY
jgi:hypothetical protein